MADRPDLSALRIDEHARRGPQRHGRRVLVIVAVGVLAVGGTGYALLREQVPEVQTAIVRADKGGRPALLNASGYVTPRRRATVAAKITARVNEIYAEEGMRVEAGQVLARLDDSDAKVRLTAAIADRDATAAALGDLQVNLTNAERELKRNEELFQRRLIAEQQIDTARLAVDSFKARIVLARQQIRAADARIRMAEQDIDNCIVRAPFPGIVVSKDAQRGEMVSPISAGGGFTRTGIATLVDMTSLEIEVDVNESYIARVRDGQPVTAILDAYPDWQIPGKVRTLIPTADRQKATVKVRASFDKLDPRILPDMGVKVTFLGDVPTSAPSGGRVLAPRTAIRDEGGKPTVFLYRDGRVERRVVGLGQARGNDQEVIAGLADGDQIVTAGAKDLRDGQRVSVKR
ncbi:MAG TPA: efflux RND transporter periplasmic adaptor subunit [Methylomirabilota bacterium]|jgi:RND family efflux transporter MFP subunit|nr:efflux RND transporter periplasmic adaptor subunit [Methylomirabilota bacterium]